MSIIDYAKSELARIGLKPDADDEINRWMYNDLIEVIECFAKQGHSGFSANYAISVLEKILRYHPITPLTGDDDEWMEVGDGVYQNVRCHHVFKHKDRFDGQAYDLNAVVFYDELVDDKGEMYKSYFTSSDSARPITFPYNPTSEYQQRKI